MVWCVVNVDLRSRPDQLVLQKWTKTGPVLDWCVLALLGGVFCNLFSVAAERLSLKTLEAADAVAASGGAPAAPGELVLAAAAPATGAGDDEGAWHKMAANIPSL